MFRDYLTILITLPLIGYCNTNADGIHFSISEEQPSNSIVGNFKEEFKQISQQSERIFQLLRYSFKQDSPLFHIDGISGVITTKQKLDREALCPSTDSCKYDLLVIVKPRQYYTTIKVIVSVEDGNDNYPTFSSSINSIEISDDTPQDAMFRIPSAVDLDVGKFGIERYYLEQDFELFDLKVTDLIDGSHDVRLVLKNRLLPGAIFNLTVIAEDGGEPPKSGRTIVVVSYKTTLETLPTFDRNVYEASVLENAPFQEEVIKISAHDIRNPAEIITYDLSAEDGTSSVLDFGIDSITGRVFVNGSVDYEIVRLYRIKVKARKMSSNSGIYAYAQLIIRVIDLNDNKPIISLNTLTESGEGQVLENSMPRTFVAHMSATDKDGEDNARVSCSLSENSRKFFTLQQIYSADYTISTALKFDREMTPHYDVIIFCHDYGSPVLSSSATLSVEILDENDNVPEFSKDIYFVNVEESNVINQTIIQLNASDPDEGENGRISYTLRTENSSETVFTIDSVTGMVYNIRAVDFEEKFKHNLVITATDNGHQPHSFNVSLVVNILDANDNPPEFLEKYYKFQISRGKAAGETIGLILAADRDQSEIHSKIVYKLIEDSSGYFAINFKSGELYTAKDVTRAGLFKFVVQAINNQTYPSLVTSTDVVVEVEKILPVITFPDTNISTAELSIDSNPNDIVSCITVKYEQPSFLRYQIINENSETLFYIESDSGCIKLKEAQLELDSHYLRIKIGDYRYNDDNDCLFIELNVRIVNESVVAGNVLNLVGSKDGLWILIGIGSGVGILLITVLITFALIMRFHRKRRRDHGDYNCRSEATKSRLQSSGVPLFTDELCQLRGRAMEDSDSASLNGDVYVPTSKIEPLSTHLKVRNDQSKKGVSFRLLDNYSEVNVPLQLSIAGITRDHCGGNFYIDNASIWRNTRLAEDSGSTGSRCSDGSVTDSGQGASEEGDSVASPEGARVRDKNSKNISNKGMAQSTQSGSAICCCPAERRRMMDAQHSPWPAHNCGISSSSYKSSENDNKNLAHLSSRHAENSWMSTFKNTDAAGVASNKTGTRSSLVLLPPQTNSPRPGSATPASSLPRSSSSHSGSTLISECPDFCPCSKRRAPSQFLHFNKRIDSKV